MSHVRGFVLGAVLIGASAAAQSPADIERCTGIAADAERLACYDKLFSHRAEHASPTPSKPATVAAPAAAGAAAAASTATKSEAAAGAATSTAAKSAPATAPATKSADDFGLDGRTPKGAKEEDKPEGPSEISARVATVAKQPGGQFVLTLDNGQVWEQQHADWHLAFKVGDEVIIKRGTFKSYRLQLQGNNRATAVTRIR